MTDRLLTFGPRDTLADRSFGDEYLDLTLLSRARWFLLSRLFGRLRFRLPLPLRFSLLLRHPPGLEAAAFLLLGTLRT